MTLDINQILLPIIFLLILTIITLSGWLLIQRLRSQKQVTRALNMSLFLITLPKKVKAPEGEAAKSAKEIISVMEQFYASLSNLREKKGTFLYGQPHLVFEIATPQIGEEISFYLAVPRGYEDVLEKQIHGFYPQASVEKTEDYNIFNPTGQTAGAYLKLVKNYVLPFKTYQNLETDPLNEMTNTLSKLAEQGEGAAVQIVIRPAPAHWQSFGLRIAKEMQAGKSYQTAKTEATSFSFVKIIDSIFKTFSEGLKTKSKTEPESGAPQTTLTPLQQEIIKALETKAGKVGFETNIRCLVSAANRVRAEQLLSHLESAFVQFSAPNLNGLKSLRVSGRALKKLIYHFSFRLFNPQQKLLLNTEELTSLFHFPSIQLETPKVKALKAKPASPPANLPKEGLILGRNLYRGQETIVRCQKDDRRRHLYIVGQTGTGKSVFLQNLIVQDIKNKEGVALLDPHGDLIEEILGLVPQERIEDVILIDPADLERPIGLNMLEYDPAKPEQKTFIVNELINIFQKLFAAIPEALGPMFEQYTRNALLLLMDDPKEKFTLMEVPKVLADQDFRHRLLAKCQNTIVKDFWEKEAEKAGGEAALANMTPYITSKFNIFIANDYMRPIIGQSTSTLNFRQIIDEGKILLVNLSKGKLGDINSHLLGMMLTGKLLMAALGRVSTPQEERRDFYLYMDEFQNFTTESIATILSEARKYRLCLIIAHQFIGQLEEKIKGAVFGNVGSMVSFRVGAEDAEFLVKQFEPVFDQQDLINLDNFNAYIKLMLNNETSQSFNLLSYPPAKGSPEIAQTIKQSSSQKYGRAKAKVEEEILRRR